MCRPDPLVFSDDLCFYSTSIIAHSEFGLEQGTGAFTMNSEAGHKKYGGDTYERHRYHAG